jgi:diguanylate cyclase
LRLFKLALASSAEFDNMSQSRNDAPLNGVRREQLIDRIRDFFSENKVEVTSENLLAVHAAFSGASPRMARKFGVMREENRPITQAWLDQVAEKDEDGGQRDNAQQLLHRLSTRLEVFTSTAARARSDSGSYHAALEQVASVLPEGEGGDFVSSLAELTRAMIERTHLLEESMRRSEDEATALRKSLDRAQRDAHIDHLTGLPNRRAFEVVLETEYRAAQVAIEPLCLVFCDIDHFKRINDTHGHDAGDRVIQAIAQMLQRLSDDKCHVARHGGEEFVMLFRDKTPTQVYELMDEARERLASRNFVNRKSDEGIGQITISGGVANVFAYPDARAALEAADEALYRAKRGGRNRICMA